MYYFRKSEENMDLSRIFLAVQSLIYVPLSVIESGILVQSSCYWLNTYGLHVNLLRTNLNRMVFTSLDNFTVTYP